MRLIDADELPKFGHRGGLVHWKDIKNAPTIYIEERLNDAYAHGWSDAEAKYHDSVEVVHGEWLWLDGVRCSRCNYKLATTGLPSYCPNCGALMMERSRR